MVRPARARPGREVSADLDELLFALSDPTRRAVVGLLGRSPRRSGEIAAALRDDAEIGQRTGLLGIRLPGLRLPGLPASKPAIVPERFADNVDAGYATFRPYPASSEELRAWVESALVDRQYRTPDNRRPLRIADDPCPHERTDA